MHATESRTLKRAVAILMAVSAARWAWGPATPPAPEGAEVLPELLAESQAHAVEAARRSAPLAPGERVDPNRADEVELDRLPGVGPSTARAIVEARDSGVVFRRAKDLTAIRGIGTATVERLKDALDLDAPPASGGRPRVGAVTRLPSPGPGGVPGGPVDLNRAGEEELQTLPGIGPALSRRIVEERGKRMFMSLEDLTRVRGVGPATVDRLRGLAIAGGYR